MTRIKTAIFQAKNQCLPAQIQRFRFLFKRLTKEATLLLALFTLSAASPLSRAESVQFDAPTAFGTLPAIRNFSLSPDGEMAVVLRPIGDTYHVTTLDLETGASKVIMAANPDEFLFNWCQFANNKRIICSIRSYLVPKSAAPGLTNTRAYLGGRTVATRLLAINADGSNQIQLVKQKRTSVGRKLQWIDQSQDDIVDWLADEPNHILIALTREHRRFPAVYRLNINNNRIREVQPFRKGIYRWGADRNGRVIHGFGQNAAGKASAFFINDKNFSELDLSHLSGVQGIEPLAYSPSGKSVYVLANAGKNTRSVIEVDSKTAKIRKVLAQSDQYDARGVLLSRATGRVLATHQMAERFEYQWLDSELEQSFKAVKSRLPAAVTDMVVISADAAINKIAFRAWGSGEHPAYYLFNRAEKTLTKLSTLYASVPSERLNTKLPVSFKARDGLEIPAYLTLPARGNKQNLPTVILPHGGPYARDNARFDYWSQFLAASGYAVLQPNYRGSSGYGDDYLSKGFKQWGRAMQDDLDDGLDWMVKQGYTDASRVCMLGGSYGGYAALVASFRSTDKYQCAVSFAGVADLDRLVDRWALSYGLSSAAQRVQRGSQRDKYSPLKQIDNIDMPLLIMHGDVDERVQVVHSRALVAALEKSKKAHTYIELPNGDHHLSLQSHRISFLSAVEGFLNKHIGPLSGE